MGFSDSHNHEPYVPLHSVILVSKLTQNIHSNRREDFRDFSTRALVIEPRFCLYQEDDKES